MKIVIDIPEQIYKELTETAIMVTEVYPSTIERALTEGIVLPKGHGRLGDLDALYQEIKKRGWFDSDDTYYGGGLEDIVLDAPTIIEADEEGGLRCTNGRYT